MAHSQHFSFDAFSADECELKLEGVELVTIGLSGFFVPSGLLETDLERSFVMPKKRFSAEQIVTLLRQIEVAMSAGKSAQLACREAGISEQSFYRWRKEYGGLDLDQARKMKELEKENVRLKRLVADLSLEKQVLKDIASGNL
jgi:putative transposase